VLLVRLVETVRVLRALHERLGEAEVAWAVSGSASLSLQGLPLSLGDVDVETDALGAYRIQDACKDWVIRPVTFVASDQVRSHWGALEVQGWQVEIMGDFQVRGLDGTWGAPGDVRHLRLYVDHGDLAVPVMPLAYVRDAYRLLGKTGKADLIDRWLSKPLKAV
jgi:hypothetical protein